MMAASTQNLNIILMSRKHTPPLRAIV